MSKNITIQEGGVDKSLTVDKLKTNLVGGGTCLWLPEDEVPLGTKSVNKNGTYKASDDGLYGYSELTVRGVGVALGKDPNGSGNDVIASVDPETGEIVITPAPSYIRVTVPPDKTRYNYDDPMDYEGMVVVAYLANGEPWTSGGIYPDGVIPHSDLILPVSTAGKSAASIETYTNGAGVVAWKVVSATLLGNTYISTQQLGVNSRGQPCSVGTYGMATLYVTRYHGEIRHVRVAGNGNGFTLYTYYNGAWHFSGGTTDRTQWQQWKPGAWKEYFTDVPESSVDPWPGSAYDMQLLGREETIPVQFMLRSGDVLEDSFKIYVEPFY